MKVDFYTLEAIYKQVGEFEIQPCGNEVLIKFDYWKAIDLSKIEIILPPYLSLTQETEYDEDVGYWYVYRLKHIVYA